MSCISNGRGDHTPPKSEEWNFFALLHNLSISNLIGNEHISIVPKDDTRVTHLCEKFPTFCRLVENFTGLFGNRFEPSLLLIRKDFPRDKEGITAFRNALALSAVVRSWEYSLSERRHDSLFYSNYFDIYPYYPVLGFV